VLRAQNAQLAHLCGREAQRRRASVRHGGEAVEEEARCGGELRRGVCGAQCAL
jgi:hypothetical protein